MRRFSTVLFCFIFLLTALFCVGVSPYISAVTVEEKEAEARRVLQQIDALKAQSQKITEEYNTAMSELESIRMLINENEEKLEKAQKDYQRSKSILENRLRYIYIIGDVTSVEVLLEATTVDDFLNRYDFLRYISNQDIAIFVKMKDLRTEIAKRQRELEEQEARRRQSLAVAQQKQAELQASLIAQQNLLNSINAEILQMVSQMSGTGGNVRIGDFVFPVRGPHSYTNDWHAPRAGHLHQGCDIFATMGTPCVACVTGTVYQSQGKNAGLYVRLVGDDGNVYYYMHLQRYGQTGRVSAGTVIGYVGDSGNAKGGPPHLHFEIHPGGGEAINPYPILKAHDY